MQKSVFMASIEILIFCRHSIRMFVCFPSLIIIQFIVYCMILLIQKSNFRTKGKIEEFQFLKLALYFQRVNYLNPKKTESSLINKYCRMNPPFEEIIDVYRKEFHQKFYQMPEDFDNCKI